jgi:energy-coupling factor transporter ATP-binding protein EcfA2
VTTAATRRLAIDDLAIRYFGRTTDALHGVSVALDDGAFVSIAGRNGAGKSTLALAAAGFIPRVVRAQATGRIEIDGEVALDRAAAAEGAASQASLPVPARHGYRAGIVFPNPGNQLSGTKATVREELAFGLENLGIERGQMDARIDRVLTDLGIEHLADRPPYAVSGGEQQRIAIASIVAMQLPLLVLDEPTAQLDPLATASVADLLRQIASDGTAVLAAEHAPAVLSRSDRTLLLRSGEVVAFEPPGRALHPDVIRRAGLEPPTIVTLAAAAGLGPADAFDEVQIAAALRARRSSPSDGPTPAFAPDPASSPAWVRVRDQPPAGVAVRGLAYRYPTGVEALRGIDLDIAPGETVAVIGQNGSGKTTLVKHFNGLLRPSAGSVEVAGRDLADVPVHRTAATVGFVFQNPDDQLFSRTVERELHFGPRNLGLEPAQASSLVQAALEAVDLAGERGTNPYDLNVSERKLVALASVLAMDPAVLVLDEPTTGQDGPGVARVGQIVDGFHAAGGTVVAITHDMEFAARHFTRVIVMRQGEVIADGPPSSVLSHESAGLLGTTGLTPPPAARIAGLLGLSGFPAGAAELLELLG